MPRKPRTYLPGLPAHVVQRGNNRNACFFAEDDCLFYLERIKVARLNFPGFAPVVQDGLSVE